MTFEVDRRWRRIKVKVIENVAKRETPSANSRRIFSFSLHRNPSFAQFCFDHLPPASPLHFPFPGGVSTHAAHYLFEQRCLMLEMNRGVGTARLSPYPNPLLFCVFNEQSRTLNHA